MIFYFFLTSRFFFSISKIKTIAQFLATVFYFSTQKKNIKLFFERRRGHKVTFFLARWLVVIEKKIIRKIPKIWKIFLHESICVCDCWKKKCLPNLTYEYLWKKKFTISFFVVCLLKMDLFYLLKIYLQFCLVKTLTGTFYI